MANGKFVSYLRFSTKRQGALPGQSQTPCWSLAREAAPARSIVCETAPMDAACQIAWKQEVGLGHYEGRGWRGFHHHATLCIAAYGFLISERGAFPPSGWLAARKLQQAVISPRGRPDPATAPSGAARDELDRDHATEAHRRPRQDAQPVSMLPRAAP